MFVCVCVCIVATMVATLLNVYSKMVTAVAILLYTSVTTLLTHVGCHITYTADRYDTIRQFRLRGFSIVYVGL